MSRSWKNRSLAQTATCRLEMISNPAALELHLAQWAELADNAVEPNPFYEPFALLPALRLLAAPDAVTVLLIWVDSPAGRQLAGLMPVHQQQLSPWLPLRSWMPWRHKYCFLGSPLIHREHAVAAWRALLQWFANRGGVSVVNCVRGGALEETLRAEGSGLNLDLAEAERHCRAFFLADDSAENYLSQAVSGRHRKAYRRLERQLASTGELAYRTVAEGQDPGAWIDDFLRIEAAGWKGRAGTSFADSAAECQYLRQLVRGAHEAGRFMGLGLYLDGKPVALKLNLLTADGGFSFKICFDEAYARYSPGVLLELENIRELHRRGVAWMDSCADEDHPMIDRLWPGRRSVRTLFVSRKWAGVASLSAPLAAARRLKRTINRFGDAAQPVRTRVASQPNSPPSKPEQSPC